MKNAFDIVKDFEQALCEYTGAPYAVAVNSCTNALFLSLKFSQINFPWIKEIEVPNKTYVSVPMQIIHAGFKPKFVDVNWTGQYMLYPFSIYDSARKFTSNIFNDTLVNTYPGTKLDRHTCAYICVSFHWSKILGIQQGGAILHNDYVFDEWARRARFDGRTEGVAPKDDNFKELGYHMYMSPEIAAEGLVRLMHLPKNNLDLPNDDYPDLSTLDIFK